MYNSFSADFSERIKKFRMSSLSRNARSSNILEMVLLLKESSLVLVAFNVTDPSTDLFSSKDIHSFQNKESHHSYEIDFCLPAPAS